MTTPEELKDRLAWLLSFERGPEIERRYDAWALEYNQDVDSCGYQTPGVVAGFVGAI